MTILELLEAHGRVSPSGPTYGGTCSCGHDLDNDGILPWTQQELLEAHRAHLAEVLEAHVQEKEAAVIASLADQLDEYQAAHDVAECAAPVEGETGRQACIDNWVEIIEEPAEWLRKKAGEHTEKGFEYLRYIAFEAWQAGEEAGWENGRNSYLKENGYIEDLDPIENPYADEENHDGR